MIIVILILHLLTNVSLFVFLLFHSFVDVMNSDSSIGVLFSIC